MTEANLSAITPQRSQWADVWDQYKTHKGAVLGMGFFASAGHYCFIKALDHAPASQLAPFGYFEIIGATLVSYFGFNEFPDALTWVGIGIVVSSGVLLTLSEALPTISPESPGGD